MALAGRDDNNDCGGQAVSGWNIGEAIYRFGDSPVADQPAAFAAAYDRLAARARALLAVGPADLDRAALQAELTRIGTI